MIFLEILTSNSLAQVSRYHFSNTDLGMGVSVMCPTRIKSENHDPKGGGGQEELLTRHVII